MHALKQTLDQFRAATAHIRGSRVFARAREDKKDEGEMYVYDVIGTGWFGGVSAQNVVDQLKDLKGIKKLAIYINSPGGDVFEGIAIYNALKRFDAEKTCYIDGLCASIASIVAIAADKVVTAENAMWMIHDPWTFAIGNAVDLRKAADNIDKAAGVMLDTYSKKCGDKASADQIKGWMSEETWMTAEEALNRGFTDEVLSDADGDEDKEAAAAQMTSPLVARFKKTPPVLRAKVDGKALLEDVQKRMQRQASLPQNPGQPGAAK